MKPLKQKKKSTKSHDCLTKKLFVKNESVTGKCSAKTIIAATPLNPSNCVILSEFILDLNILFLINYFK